MRKGGGKAKGASFEREVCTLLSLWVSHGERKDLFWRSAMSGGRATIRERKGEVTKTQFGDISAVDPLGHCLTDQYYIECKSYKNLALESFILKKTGILRQFWDKTRQEAKKYNRKPLLICRQNMYPTFVLDSRPKYSRTPVQLFSYISFNDPELNCNLILFSDFVKYARPPQ